MQAQVKNTILGSTIVILVLFLVPWRHINWGTISLSQPQTITVTGHAQSSQRNQIASFTAGVSAVNDQKEVAVEEVNTKVNELISQVKEFGIAEADIQTQNISVYQQEEPITLDGRQRFEPGQWRVSNDINITLRDVDRASELTTMLQSSGATNVYGPNFGMDDTSTAQIDLLDDALEDARSKAKALAAAEGKTVGELVNVIESTAGQNPIMMRADGLGGGGGVVVEPGSQTVTQSISATFELK